MFKTAEQWKDLYQKNPHLVAQLATDWVKGDLTLRQVADALGDSRTRGYVGVTLYAIAGAIRAGVKDGIIQISVQKD